MFIYSTLQATDKILSDSAVSWKTKTKNNIPLKINSRHCDFCYIGGQLSEGNDLIPQFIICE